MVLVEKVLRLSEPRLMLSKDVVRRVITEASYVKIGEEERKERSYTPISTNNVRII